MEHFVLLAVVSLLCWLFWMRGYNKGFFKGVEAGVRNERKITQLIGNAKDLKKISEDTGDGDV